MVYVVYMCYVRTVQIQEGRQLPFGFPRIQNPHGFSKIAAPRSLLFEVGTVDEKPIVVGCGIQFVAHGKRDDIVTVGLE
jgi:hypothetical protein